MFMRTKIFILVILVAILKNKSVTAQTIAAGGWHSVVVCNDSTVKAFGENATGQLGDGTTTDRNVPVSVIGLSGIIAVSAGGDQLEAHSMALKSDGTVWAWGSNIYGGLGNGNTSSTMVPGKVLIIDSIIAISAGGWHSAALKNDGTVWTWGWNEDGQLGDGTLNNKVVPVKVLNLTNVIQIAAGTYHMLALKSDGTVWSWGDNQYGQLGDGTNIDRTIPVQVQNLTNVVKIAAGRFFSLAVKNDGTIWTWGQNLYGQLGNGTTTDSKIPVQVQGVTAMLPAIVAAGAFHCLVVANDGNVWSWGRNTYGNLGDGTEINRYTPVQVQNINNVTELAAGTNFSLLLKNDGTFWGCGRNASGQLGDGTFLQRNTVVQSTSLCPVMQPISVGKNNFELYYVNVFPNPSNNGKYYLYFSENQNNVDNIYIELYNSLGKKLLTNVLYKGLENNFIIDLTNYKNGIYLLNIIANDKIISHKIIKASN
jgi:alpha-tubulin suppressor-like RCC1 family protein